MTKVSQRQYLFYKYDHCSEYKKILVAGKGRRRTKLVDINPAYKELLLISKKKRADLQKLCKSGLIPEEIHHWCENLPITTSETTERLPQPDMEETDEEENEF